jgi:hypothetical protein
MEPLDGNALAGALYEWFGVEMTSETGICRSCRKASMVAELRIYTRAPGAVARCPHCGNVVFVLIEVRGTSQLHLDGLDLVAPAEPGGGGWLDAV